MTRQHSKTHGTNSVEQEQISLSTSHSPLGHPPILDDLEPAWSSITQKRQVQVCDNESAKDLKRKARRQKLPDGPRKFSLNSRWPGLTYDRR
jgi:hypothetical protein